MSLPSGYDIINWHEVPKNSYVKLYKDGVNIFTGYVYEAGETWLLQESTYIMTGKFVKYDDSMIDYALVRLPKDASILKPSAASLPNMISETYYLVEGVLRRPASLDTAVESINKATGSFGLFMGVIILYVVGAFGR